MSFNFTKETPAANRKWIEEKDIADFQAIAAASNSSARRELNRQRRLHGHQTPRDSCDMADASGGRHRL